MDKPEKLATRRKQIKQKHNTICVGHHYVKANTYNVNKTWALLQTTGGNEGLNIVFMLKNCIIWKVLYIGKQGK